MISNRNVELFTKMRPEELCGETELKCLLQDAFQAKGWHTGEGATLAPSCKGAMPQAQK